MCLCSPSREAGVGEEPLNPSFPSSLVNKTSVPPLRIEQSSTIAPTHISIANPNPGTNSDKERLHPTLFSSCISDYDSVKNDNDGLDWTKIFLQLTHLFQ